MRNLYTRIQKRLDMTVRAFRQDCTFSIKLALYRLGDDLGGRLGFEKLSWQCNAKKHQWITSYLSGKMSPLLDEYKYNAEQGIKEENAPIWVCWWDGEENAPLLVKQCIKSIYRNSKNHPVNFISRKNVAEYVDIPDYMLDKVQRKQMCLAHLSDYIRVCLLAKYGGLWLDATIFCSRPLSEDCFSVPIFSMKSKPQKSKFVTEHQWVCFCLGAWKNNALFEFLKVAFERYWSTEQVAIDYCFFDYLLLLGLEKIPAAKCYDSVPVNNPHRDDLQAAMNAAIDADNFESIIFPDTIFYKLSWRETYSLISADGRDSIYKKFLDLKLQ